MALLAVFLFSLSLFSCVLSSPPCDTVVLLQCPKIGDHPMNQTTYLPMKCNNGGGGWDLVAEPFSANVPYDDITHDVISSAGVGGMIYYLTPFPHVLLGFNLSNGGKQELSVQTQGLQAPFWMLQYPPQPHIFLVMADFQYGTLDSTTGQFTKLYDLRANFEAVGFRQRSLSADFSTIWFEALYAFGAEFKTLCTNVCMLGLDPLTGVLGPFQSLDVEPTWISSSPLFDGDRKDFSSVFISVFDPTHSIAQTGSVSLATPQRKPKGVGLFSGPMPYIPQGDFDVSDGPYGQFYYVTNASFPTRTKYYHQIDMDSGDEKVVMPIPDDVVAGMCASESFTTSAVTFVLS